MRLSILFMTIVSLCISANAAPIGRHRGLARGYRYNKARGYAPTVMVSLLPRQPAEQPADLPSPIVPEVESSITGSLSSSVAPVVNDNIMEDQYSVVEPTDGTIYKNPGEVAYNNLYLKKGAVAKLPATGTISSISESALPSNAPIGGEKVECQPCTAEVCAAVCIPINAGSSAGPGSSTTTTESTTSTTDEVSSDTAAPSSIASSANGGVPENGSSEMPVKR